MMTIKHQGEDDGFEYTEDGWRIHPEDMYRCRIIKIKTRTMMMTMPRDHGNDYSDTEIKEEADLDALYRIPR